ncbi:MAG: hypothetical protein R6X32_15010 [Chloroflexota bacterium]
MESIITLIEQIPPTFWGIIVGALFTTIGVVLTNAANIKRLRLQQAYERERAEKQWDTNLRRDTYLSAIEAISAGMVVVGRFADFGVPHQELMRSYTDKSPSIAKVTLVGKEETIEAVANFSQLLTGAFLRLSAKREQMNGVMARSAALEGQIETAREEEARVLALIHEHELSGHANEALAKRLAQKLAGVREKIESLQAEETAVDTDWMSAQMELVQKSIEETAELDRMLIPVISRIRQELGLPFDEAFYTQVIETGHKNQAEFLNEFIRDLPPEATP